MNVQATRADFNRALKIASKATERRSIIPILTAIHCRANGKLEMTGTDLDISVSASVPRVAGKDMAFAIMAPNEVGTSIAQAGGDMVEMIPSDGKVAVNSGLLRLKTGTLPADDFPMLYSGRPLAPTFTATFSPEHIRSLARIAAAISTEETRYYLNGINFKRIEGTTYRAAATDGHRLCCIDLNLPDATGEFDDVIIPRKVVSLLIDLAGKASGGVKVTLGTVPPANRDDSTAPARSGALALAIAFDVPGASVAMGAKLIDGTYPDYARVIPANNDKQMLFNTAELRRALKGISGHSKKIRAAKIVLGDGVAKISACYVDIGLDAAIEVECRHSHTGFEIGLNGNYLMSMIDAAQGDEVLFVASDQSGPVLVKNPSDTDWTGVLMPMRVG